MRRQRDLTPEAEKEMQQRVLRRYKSDWPDVAPLLAAPDDSKLWYSTLAAHDRAHENTNIEWWYVNGHVSEDVSFFAAFFRLYAVDAKTLKDEGSATEADIQAALNSRRAHAVNWALIDRRAGTYRTYSYLDRETFSIMDNLHELEIYQGDKHVMRATRELFKNRRLLAPDHVMSGEVKCSTECLDIDMEGCTFTSRPVAGDNMVEYVLHLQGVEDATGESATLDAVLRPTKQPVLHGTNGVVAMEQEFNSDDMFYYFIPRCSVTGSMCVNNGATSTFSGVGWIDHEFGGAIGCTREEVDFALVRPVRERQGMELIWEWAAVQLDNDAEVSLTLLIHPETRAILQRFAIVRSGRGAGYRLQDDAIQFGAVEGHTWKSQVTGCEFPLVWAAKLALRDGTHAELLLEAKLHNQEFVTIAAKPSFWEGHVAVTGKWGGVAVAGDGFMECRAAQHPEAIDAIFELMRSMLFDPLEAALPMLPAEAATPAVYEPMVATMVMMATMMAAGNGVPLTPAHSSFLTALLAAYVAVRKQGVNVRGRALDYLDAAWHKTLGAMERVNLSDLMLRAFSMRVLDDVLKPAAVVAPAAAVPAARPVAAAAASTSAAGVNGSLERFGALAGYAVRPFEPREGGTSGSVTTSKEEVQALRENFAGMWVLDKSRSELLGDFLACQNVNMVVRALVNRLTPRLEFAVEEEEGKSPLLITKIRTAMSNEAIRLYLGEASTYHSSGRGNLTAFTVVQDGGSTIYTRTPILCGPRAVEHKWLRYEGVQAGAKGAAEKRVITEFYRFDPDGVLNAKSMTAGRVFTVVDN